MDQTSKTEKIHQKQKFEEIKVLLVTAGYNRASVSTLSEFDVVIGGLCWCIMSAGGNVDVDILFQENVTIGQRIILSESIIEALRKMGCISPLQAHQIQGGVGGSDFAAIHCVVKWLIDKVYERRLDYKDQLRGFATLQYSKKFPVGSSHQIRSNQPLSDIINKQKVVRQFRRKSSLLHDSEEKLVMSCLLEYGETFVANSNVSSHEPSRIVLNFSDAVESSLDGLFKHSNELYGFDSMKIAQTAKDA